MTRTFPSDHHSAAVFTLALACLLGGCTMDAQNAPEEEIETASDGITNATATPEPAYAINIGGCTGSVISQHYILTAGHCFESSGTFNRRVRTGINSEILVYSGPVDVAVHPNFVSGAEYVEAWDIALVRLRNNGMGSTFPRVQIYAGPETPWTSSGGLFYITGYGLGTDPGGAKDCAHAGLGGIKRGANFAFRGEGVHEGSTWFSVRGYSSLRTTCAGDSGAPYLLTRNGEDFLFAVHRGSTEVPNGSVGGAMVQPKLAWIQARSADTLGLPLTCGLVRDHRVTPEVHFYNCTERPPPPVVHGIDDIGTGVFEAVP